MFLSISSAEGCVAKRRKIGFNEKYQLFQNKFLVK